MGLDGHNEQNQQLTQRSWLEPAEIAVQAQAWRDRTRWSQVCVKPKCSGTEPRSSAKGRSKASARRADKQLWNPFDEDKQNPESQFRQMQESTSEAREDGQIREQKKAKTLGHEL